MPGFIKIKQLNSGSETQGKTLLTDGNGGFTYEYSTPKGVEFPNSPVQGDTFYRTDSEDIFIYDSTRNKWLSISRNSLICGRDRVEYNISGYMYVGNAVQSSTSGFKMPYNGTILSISIQNSNILTNSRTMDVRINNSTTDRIQLTINSGNSGIVSSNVNTDFNSGDLIQCVLLEGDDTLDNVIVMINIARRV